MGPVSATGPIAKRILWNGAVSLNRHENRLRHGGSAQQRHLQRLISAAQTRGHGGIDLVSSRADDPAELYLSRLPANRDLR